MAENGAAVTTVTATDADALAALQTAAKLSPGNPQILMALSEYYMATGRFDEARAAFRLEAGGLL